MIDFIFQTVLRFLIVILFDSLLFFLFLKAGSLKRFVLLLIVSLLIGWLSFLLGVFSSLLIFNSLSI